jgi:DNA-binding transcriptional ArsR family regulator
MIRYELTVEDLADTRFAITPVAEAVFSLWALREPGRHTLHLPWRRSVLDRLAGLDTRLLLSLVGETRAVPDFLTPRPHVFSPELEDELAVVGATPPDIVRRDIAAAHAPAPIPAPLRAAGSADDTAVAGLRDSIVALLRDYWEVALGPGWPRMRLVLEADTTYRARQLAIGGARLMFAGMHPNLRWDNGVLEISEMIGHHDVAASGQGLLLLPSVFAYKPVPPMSPEEPPALSYPSRGVGTLWMTPPAGDPAELDALIGTPRARLLRLLDEPAPGIELARRLSVTPSAVAQHLKVLHATRLLTRVRDGRHVLYRRSPLGDELVAGSAPATARAAR